jgi:hypothetical protein
MAAPVAGFVQLPSDAGNAGKKIRTQTRVVGSDTVHEHFVIAISARSKVGVYYAHSGTLTIPAAAHVGTTTGHTWLFNPVGSAVKLALRRIREIIQFTVTSAVDVSVPRQLWSLFTFTGTASGAQITPAKRDSTDSAPVGNLRTASTGLTVTLGAAMRGVLPPIVATASSATIQSNMPAQVGQPWEPEEDGQIVLRAGEGIVNWSADAATTGNRRMVVDTVWEEYE